MDNDKNSGRLDDELEEEDFEKNLWRSSSTIGLDLRTICMESRFTMIKARKDPIGGLSSTNAERWGIEEVVHCHTWGKTIKRGDKER